MSDLLETLITSSGLCNFVRATYSVGKKKFVALGYLKEAEAEALLIQQMEKMTNEGLSQ